MPCPFCLISSAIPSSPDPPVFSSPAGSAYPVLATPLVVAFLDIAPLSPGTNSPSPKTKNKCEWKLQNKADKGRIGHLLLCPREHREKTDELTPSEAAGIGFWLQLLSRAVMRALWGGDGGCWNIVQANGMLLSCLPALRTSPNITLQLKEGQRNSPPTPVLFSTNVSKIARHSKS